MANVIVVLDETQVETLLELVTEHRDGVKSGNIVYGGREAQSDAIDDLDGIETALRAADVHRID